MEYKKIGELFSYVSRGKSPKYVDNSDICIINQACIRWDGVDYTKVKYQDASSYREDTCLHDGDIVLTSTGTGTLGRCCVFHRPDQRVYVADSHVTVLRGAIGILPDILCLYLRTQRGQNKLYAECVNGSTNQIELSKEKLRLFVIPVPTMTIQRALVSQTTHINKIIELRKTELFELDSLVKARFVEMFGDIIRNDKGWHQRIFSEIATSRLGKMLDAKQQTGKHSYPYLANFNVQWFRFELKSLNQMDFDEDDQIEFALQDGDLLVCEGGEIGRCAVWHNEIQPCFFQKALHRIRCDRSIILPDYLAWWFKYNCDHGGFAAIEGAKATIAHLPGAKLKNLIVSVPPVSVQEEFVVFVAQVDKSKFSCECDGKEAYYAVKYIWESLCRGTPT